MWVLDRRLEILLGHRVGYFEPRPWGEGDLAPLGVTLVGNFEKDQRYLTPTVPRTVSANSRCQVPPG